MRPLRKRRGEKPQTIVPRVVSFPTPHKDPITKSNKKRFKETLSGAYTNSSLSVWWHNHSSKLVVLDRGIKLINRIEVDVCMMTPFDHKYQNPSGFACLMLIRATVIFTTLGIQNLNKKRKTNWMVVAVVKWRHGESFIYPLGHVTSLIYTTLK